MAKQTVVVLDGDQTGQELLMEALRVLDSSVIGLELDFVHFDLSLEHRRATNNAIVHEAAAAMKAHRLGLKAATITPEGRGDVGSPNAILRAAIDGTVIVRTGRRIPACGRSQGSMLPFPSSAWRSATRTAPRNGVREKVRARWPTAPNGSSEKSVVWSQSTRSSTHAEQKQKSSADQSTRSAPCTKGC